MNDTKTGHFNENTGHRNGTGVARARSYAAKKDLSHCPVVPKNGTQQGDVWDGTLRPSAYTSPLVKTGWNWMHIAALNLIDDAKAGIAVDPGRLAAAKAVQP